MTQPTQLNHHWYDFLEEVANSFYRALSVIRARTNENTPLSPLLAIRSGYAESPGWLMVQAAEFDPEPLTFQNLRVRHIYGAERMFQALLQLLASEKWFDRNARDEYSLTTDGRAMLDRIFARRRRALELLDASIASAGTAQLADTLDTLITAQLDAPHTFCLAHSRHRAPLQGASTAARIFQSLEDFNAIRDDSHMAAWQPLGVTGVEWETFAFVAEEQATTPEALSDQLYYRGFTRTEFADTLNSLSWRGWLEQAEDGTWHVTAEGRQIRADAETKTDDHFFTSWKTLSPDDLTRLHDQLDALKMQLDQTFPT